MTDAATTAAKLMGADDYAATYLIDMDFERHLIAARQDRCLAFLAACQPETLLEVGCGPDLLVDRLDLAASSIVQWMVVEPSFYADRIAQRMADCPKLRLTRGYLEDRVDALLDVAPGRYDAVLLSGLLHETANPQAMLSAAHALLAPGGHLFVSVPNALSFHRLLGVEMGLLQSPAGLSARNVELGQPLVFDRQALEEMVEKAGFEDLHFSGYMFKPFANDQMARVITMIGDDVVGGLNRLGAAFPEHAAEIAVIARKRPAAPRQS
ncbi:MAG: class I SAM-dependent methyltransferase [Sphingobium sp.]